MKKIVKLITIDYLILVGCNPQPKLNNKEMDKRSEVNKINITTASGWVLTIKRVGSDQVGFGSHAIYFANFEKYF